MRSCRLSEAKSRFSQRLPRLSDRASVRFEMASALVSAAFFGAVAAAAAAPAPLLFKNS